MHAFSFTETAEVSDAPSFVVAGSGEAREGTGSYEEKTVRLGDVSPGGMLEKAQFVLGEMERRMTSLGFGWADTTAVQVYTIHDIHPFLESEIAARGALVTASLGIFAARPSWASSTRWTAAAWHGERIETV